VTLGHPAARTSKAQVLVDLRWSQGQPAGIGRYILDLAVALNEHLTVRGLVRVGSRPTVPFEVTRLPDLPNFRFDLFESLIARKTRLPLISLSRLPVLLARKQAIPLIFDLSPLILPHTHPAVRGLLERLTYPVAARADTIITLSQTSRRDLVQRLAVPDQKICVVYPGRSDIAEGTTTPAGPERLRELGIGGDYVLAVGTLEPRKNLAVLVDAFSNRLRNQPVQLVVAGGLGWKYRPILQQMDSLRRDGKLLYLGYVSERDKALLYRHAVCLAYPSLYEGFGLPILEAMTHGTVAVVSNAPACVEVIGLAGFTLDPNDGGAWSEAIAQLIRDPARRAELGRLGQERSAHFTWQRSIRPLVERLTQAAAAAAA
jgi:glycosyltransferase involved in cell wall biosynthesis